MSGALKREALGELLRRMDARSDVREWAATQPDLRTAWEHCERADHMLWLAAKLLPRPIVVQAACDCAETSLHLIADGGGQMAAILAIHVTREWAEGETDLETVRAASAAASPPPPAGRRPPLAGRPTGPPVAVVVDAASVAVDAAYYAAYSAYYAVYAACVACVANAAVDAAYYAAYSAYSAAYYAAYSANASAAGTANADTRAAALASMAGLVRARISADVICAAGAL